MSWFELRPTTISSVPSPERSVTATAGHTREPLVARARRAPVDPFTTTRSYEPQTTSGWPSPSKSATAGEAYQPVWHQLAKQPAWYHFSTGAAIGWASGRAGPANTARHGRASVRKRRGTHMRLR